MNENSKNGSRQDKKTPMDPLTVSDEQLLRSEQRSIIWILGIMQQYTCVCLWHTCTHKLSEKCLREYLRKLAIKRCFTLRYTKMWHNFSPIKLWNLVCYEISVVGAPGALSRWKGKSKNSIAGLVELCLGERGEWEKEHPYWASWHSLWGRRDKKNLQHGSWSFSLFLGSSLLLAYNKIAGALWRYFSHFETCLSICLDNVT